jgi:putative salt-induced outer membrane protein YdiY
LYYVVMLLGIFAILFIAASPALADEVRLLNGDRLTGKITRLQGGKLTIETDMAGTVVIPFENIATFSTDEPIDLHLDDGSALKQKVKVSEAERRVEMESSDVLGEQTISLDRVSAINPRPTQWDGSLTLGAEIDVGDTEERNYNVRFEAVRRSKVDRINFLVNYAGERNKATGDWVTTKREMEAALDYDFFITEKTFVWGGALAEKDGMADLDVRFVGGGGLGYQWIEEDDLKFNTRAGMTWVSENYSDLTDDESYIGARLGYRLDYKFWEDFGLFNVTDWIASLESRYDQLVKSSAGLRVYFITELYGEARVDWEWDSSPAQNANRQDATYLIGVGWSF